MSSESATSSNRPLKRNFKFSQQDVLEFARISGDRNPLHLDSEFTKTTPFGKPIIHGMLSASIFSKLLGMEFPGTGTIYLEQSLKFHKPMFVDIEYVATLTLKSVENGIFKISTEIHSNSGELTLSGEATVLNRTTETV